MFPDYTVEIKRDLKFENPSPVVLISKQKVTLFQTDCSILECPLDIDVQTFRLVGNLESSVTCVNRLQVDSEEKEAQTSILIGCEDGSLELLDPTSYTAYNSLEAHIGPVSSVAWNKQGTSFLTTGVDGCVKQWSQKGALRATLLRLTSSVQKVSWAHDALHIAASCQNEIYVIDLRQQRTSRKWSSHSRIILDIEWSPTEMIIVSVGDDRRYYLHDSIGTRLYSSDDLIENANSVSWASNGNFFCLGATNYVLLCASTGEQLSQMNIGKEYIQCLQWIPNSNKVVASGVGSVLLMEVKQTVDGNCISECYWERMQNALCIKEQDFTKAPSICAASEGFNFLVMVTTDSQCLVLPRNESDGLALIDLDFTVREICQSSEKFLLLSDQNGLNIYSYNGIRISTLQLSEQTIRAIKRQQIAMNNKTVAIVESPLFKRVQLYDIQLSQSMSSVNHSCKIQVVDLCQGTGLSRTLGAFINSRQELYLFYADDGLLLKIENFVTDVKWHSQRDSLAVIMNRNLVIWHLVQYLEQIRFLVDSLKKAHSEILEEKTIIQTFQDSVCTLASKQSGIQYSQLDAVFLFLYELTECEKWSDALKLCRMLDTQEAWKYLGALSIVKGKDDITKVSMVAIRQVEYLNLFGDE